MGLQSLSPEMQGAFGETSPSSAEKEHECPYAVVWETVSTHEAEEQEGAVGLSYGCLSEVSTRVGQQEVAVSCSLGLSRCGEAIAAHNFLSPSRCIHGSLGISISRGPQFRRHTLRTGLHSEW